MPLFALALGAAVVPAVVASIFGRRGVSESHALLLGAVLVAQAWRLAASVPARRASAAAIGLVLVSALALPLWLRAASRPTAPGSSRRSGVAEATAPSLVLVVLDTVGAAHLRRYGYERDTMPRLEAWARDGATFLRAVSPGAWTSPSHASLFSGLTVSRHGVHAAADGSRLDTRAREAIAWLPARLRRAGYRTVAISANGLALPRGLDGFDERLVPVRHRWSRQTIGAAVGGVLTRDLDRRLGWQGPYLDARGIADLTRARLDGDPGPTFLFLNFMDAHAPYDPPRAALDALGLPPAEALDRFADGQRLTADWDRQPAGAVADLTARYDGELRGLDDELVPLLDWLRIQLGDATLFVVTSDHGEELGEHGRVGHLFGVPQRLVHVPLFVRHPSVSPTAVDAPVSTRRIYDLFDTAGRTGAVRTDLLQTHEWPGVLTERYPSGPHRYLGERTGQPFYRPWVALVGPDRRVVGPASEGVVVEALDDRFAERAEPVTATDETDAWAERVEAYWSAERDRRTGEAADAPLGADELERLRALGYVR